MAKEKQKKNPHTEQSSGVIRNLLKRYFVDAVSAMALGLFASLIIGLILSQLSKIPYLGFLSSYSNMASSGPVVGAAIGAAIAWGLKAKPLVIFSCVVVGAFGYEAGGPVGAYAATVVGAELARLVAGRTKRYCPNSSGNHFAWMYHWTTGGSSRTMVYEYVGRIDKYCDQLLPLLTGLVISVVVGMALTAPISSAALCIMLDLQWFSCRGCYRRMLCTNDRVCRH